MQREAQRAAEKVARLKTAQAEVAARMSADRELLASPDLLQNHPELDFERVASQGALPLLGAAQRLLKNLQLSDFRHAAYSLANNVMSTMCSLSTVVVTHKLRKHSKLVSTKASRAVAKHQHLCALTGTYLAVASQCLCFIPGSFHTPLHQSVKQRTAPVAAGL